MKKRTKLFRTLRAKILYSNGLLFLAAFSIAMIFISSMSINRIQDLEYNSNANYLSNTMRVIDLTLKDMAQVTFISYSDQQVEEILLNYQKHGEKQQIQDRNYLHGLIQSLIYIKSEIKAVYVFDNKNLVYGYDQSQASDKNLLELVNEPWYTAFQNENANRINNCILLGAHHPGFIPERLKLDPFDSNYIAIAREIKRFYPHETMGYMLIMSPVKTIKEIIEENKEEDSIVYLLDDEGKLVFEETGQYLGQSIENVEPGLYSIFNGVDNNGRYQKGKQSYLASSYHSDYSNWTLITLRRTSQVYRGTWMQIWQDAGICLIVLVLALLVMNALIQRALKGLKALSSGMIKAIHLDFTTDLQPDKEDEIGQLTRLFNQMVDTINTLLVSKYEAAIKLRNMQLKQKEYQLISLRNQINPHFLYNTLDTLRMKAVLNGDDEVAEMAFELAAFFRHTVYMDTQLVTLEEEIQGIQLYLKLIQKRYKQLIYESDIPETLTKIEMPNFILQPIVENCILHGLKECNYKGKIEIKAETLSKENDEIKDFIITISDNGVGMDPSLMRDMNKMLRQISPDDEPAVHKKEHLGLDNVQQRLSQYYPPGYGIQFKEDYTCGTQVVIRCLTEIQNPDKEQEER